MRGLAFARTSIEGIPGIIPNKLYMNTKWDAAYEGAMSIINETGLEIYILEKGCAFLNGKNWEFIQPNELGELI
jgi:hypothetical protein